MRNRHYLLASLLVLVTATLSGCSIYWGDDGDDCYGGNDLAAIGLRNPENGSCEYLGGGGGSCGGGYRADAEGNGAPAPLPDWGQCPSECESLTENQCMAAERCRAIYTETPCPPDAFCEETEQPRTFRECWSIAPSGPAYERVACESLDAYECSRHNDCVGVYTDFNWLAAEAPPLQFSSCAAEAQQGCYGDAECPEGWNCTSDTDCLPPPGCDPSTGMACPPVCYGVCEPPAGSCALIDCAPGWHCEETCFPCDSQDMESCDAICRGECVPDQNMCPLECPPDSECVEICNGGGMDPGGSGGGDSPQPVCQWQCVPVGTTCAAVTCQMGETCEIQCNAAGACQPVCVPQTGGACAAVDCGPGYHCEESCANGQCTATCTANQDPGACTGDVVCDSIPPSCPTGTVPGIRNGCWTGYCIPEVACGFMTPNP